MDETDSSEVNGKPNPTGRGRDGRFAPGNKLAPGNPISRRIAYHRAMIARTETPERVKQVLDAMHTAALQGDATAAKVYLERVLGPAASIEIHARIESLETELERAAEVIRVIAHPDPQSPRIVDSEHPQTRPRREATG